VIDVNLCAAEESYVGRMLGIPTTIVYNHVVLLNIHFDTAATITQRISKPRFGRILLPNTHRASLSYPGGFLNRAEQQKEAVNTHQLRETSGHC
jgi:hypothetical protein